MHGALGKVHGGRALVGLFVERTAFRHVVRDVRDVHAEPVIPVRQQLERDRVVEIPGVLAVDGHRRQRPEISPATEVFVAHVATETPGLLNGFGDHARRGCHASG